MISRFFDRTVVIRRLKDTSGNKTGYQATATADGAIQEMDREARATQGILEKRAWLSWFDVDTEIQEGDLVTDQSSGQRYRVLEVTTKEYGINQHKQVILEEYNA